MDAHSPALLLKDLAVVIVSATLSMRIFSLLKLPQLLGFILVGIILSPVADVISSADNIAALGELGVMLMMFFVGMEFNLERLKKVFAPSLFGIAFQIVAMGILGMVSAEMLGLSKTDGIFLGGVLAMSSTIVIVEIFAQRRDLSKLYAQIAIGILIIEDIFAVFLIVVLSGLSSGGLPGIGELFRSTLSILSFMITIFVVGKLVVPRLLYKFALSGNRQELIMLVFCLILGLGELAEMSNLSLSLGAFMAGSIISGSDAARKVEHIVDPFRNLFVALFFVSVGTQINPSTAVDLWLPILIISGCVIAFQTLACFCGITLAGVRCRDAYIASINKAQIGEFSFVIAGLGISSGIMDPSIMVIAMGVSFLTVFANPFIAARSETVMSFAKSLAPKKLLDALDIYRKAVSGMSRSAAGSAKLREFLPSVAAIFIYTLIFSGVMFAAAHIAGVIRSESTPYPDWMAFGIWMAAAALSMPPLAGVLKASGNCAAKIVSITYGRYNLVSGDENRLHAFLRGVFSAFVMLIFASVYFVFAFNFLPIGDAFATFGATLLFMALFFRRILSNFRHSMEGRFSSVLKNHLENAEHNRREAILDSVRASRAWAKNIAEIEIGEFSEAAGRTVGELGIRSGTGAEVAAVKRGAFSIYDISADTRLFPDDIVILCGTDRQIAEAEKILERVSSAPQPQASCAPGPAGLAVLSISENSGLIGESLKSAALPAKYGVKVMGILYSGSDQPSQPDPSRPLEAADRLLCMGTRGGIERLSSDMNLLSDSAP